MWRYRELLCFLTWRDVSIRYKQAVLGVLWAFIQPFTRLVVFSLIFGRLAGIDSEGYPYPIFVFAGMLPWESFSEALTRCSNSVVASGGLITKIYFPRLLIPLASVGGVFVDFCISFGILLGLMLYYHIPFTVTTLLVIPLGIFTAVTSLGVGVLLSSLSVKYRDFRFVIPFLLQIWMFLTPVLYPVTVFGEKWQWLVALNPMAGIVDAYRSAILGRAFALSSLGISLAMSVCLFIIAIYVFRRMEHQFADVI